MDSGKFAQDAPADSPVQKTAAPSSVDEDVTFERFAHDFVARRETPLANALRAHLGVRKSEVATKTFKASFLEAELAKLTGSI